MISPIDYTITDSERLRVNEVQKLEGLGSGGVSGLLKMLSDSSWVVRRAVIAALGALGELSLKALIDELTQQRSNEARIAATVDSLVASTGNADEAVAALASFPNPAIVADVAQILGRRRNPDSVPVLVKLISHENDNVAVGAIEALGRIGGRAAIEALIGSIETGNFFRTFPAIDVLGRSGDPRVVAPLSKLLDNPNYSVEAVRALGRVGERSALKPLMPLLKSPSDSIVRIAAVAVSELKDRIAEKSGSVEALTEEQFKLQMPPEAVRRLSRVLPDAEPGEAVSICKLLGIAGSAEAAAQLSARLDGHPLVAEAAAEALKKIGKNADDYLKQAIREGQSERRKILLPVVNRSSAAEDVAVCLSDEDPEVRSLACETLSRLGVTSVVPSLFKLLTDSNLRVVHAAVAAIQALGSREARTLAVEAFQSTSPGVRRSALNILSYFGDSSATQSMLAGLEDPDQRVREAAIQGLPFLEDLRALEALYESARNSNSRVRSLAMRSLGQVAKNTERAHSVLLKGISDSDAWVRYYACQSIGRLGYQAAAPEIAKLLSDEAGQVRVSAVEALSHLDTNESHSALRSAVKSEDEDVKRAALLGLGITRRLEDLPIVLAEVASTNPPTRLLALSSLVNFQSPRVFGVLSSTATDSDEQVRSAAIGFLAALPEQQATEVLVHLISDPKSSEKAKSGLLIPSAGRTAGLLVGLETANDEAAPVLISVLTRLASADLQNALLSAMKLNNVAARKAAAVAIAAQIHKPEMRDVLIDSSENDPDREVRQICKVLLSE